VVLGSIAVTGASGMLGRHILQVLAKAEQPVTAIYRTQPKYPPHIAALRIWDLGKWKSHDELDQLFDNVKAIIHAGAEVPRLGQEISEKNLFDANVRSCLCLGQWAAERNVPLIYISGATVYADTEAKKITEDAPKTNRGLGGLYGFSKLLAEQVLDHLTETGLQSCILRPSSIYGDGLPPEKLVAKFLLSASAGETIQISPPYNERIDLVHAADVARAAYKAIELNAVGIYNVSSGDLVSIRELAETCVSVVKNGSIEIQPDKNVKEPTTRFDLDCSLAKRKLDFTPEFDLKTGLQNMWQEMNFENA
jgi:UDP-glucose 4-epimerase